MHEDKNTQPLNVNIAVENFGPIEKAEIDLRPLTVFVGESNTGKTYLAALIYALYQVFEGTLRFPWSRSGIFGLRYSYIQRHLSSSSQIESEDEILKTIQKINNLGQPFKFSDLPQGMRRQLRTRLKDPEICTDELKRCFDLESVSELIRFTEQKSKKKSGLNLNPFTRDESYKMKFSLKILQRNQTLWSHHIHDTGSKLSAYEYINENMQLLSEDKFVMEKISNVEDFLELLYSLGKETWHAYYLPAARSGIMQSHGVIVSSLVDRATRVGLERFSEIAPFSGMIADFLKHIINYRERDISDSEIYNVAKLLENDVLRGQIEINRPAGVGYPQFLYRPQNTEQSIRMSRSSSMVSELAPLVIFLRGIVKPGDTLIIEEPESHLHPRAQTKIAITLARLVQAGVRVIITTHSNWILEQIGNLVREGEAMKLGKNQTGQETWLTKEDVGAWWFRRDKPVKEIIFGDIVGIEPEDYGEVAEELYNRSVDLRTLLAEMVGESTGETE